MPEKHPPDISPESPIPATPPAKTGNEWVAAFLQGILNNQVEQTRVLKSINSALQLIGLLVLVMVGLAIVSALLGVF